MSAVDSRIAGIGTSFRALPDRAMVIRTEQGLSWNEAVIEWTRPRSFTVICHPIAERWWQDSTPPDTEVVRITRAAQDWVSMGLHRRDCVVIADPQIGNLYTKRYAMVQNICQSAKSVLVTSPAAVSQSAMATLGILATRTFLPVSFYPERRPHGHNWHNRA
jgi:hypothetical protein